MKDLNIPGGRSTPAVISSRATRTLTMRGDSYPENALDLFSPIIAWVEEQLASSSELLTLELELMYLNTSSIKAMMDIFDILQEAHERGAPVAVNWYFDVENRRVGELAEEFKEDYTFPFSILARP